MDPGLWARAALWLLAVLSVVALILLAVERFTQEAFATFGIWLMLYRLLIRTKFRGYVQAVTSFCSGASLALLAPLLTWPSALHRVPFLVLIGGFPAMASYRASSWFSTATIGTALGALLFQLGACSEANRAHAGVLAVSAATLIVVFSCTRFGLLVELLVFPSLGALLLTSSLGARFAGTMEPASLLEASSCPSKNAAAAVRTGEAWLLLALCGIVFQYVMLRNKSEDGKETDALAEFLLPSAGGPLLNKDGTKDTQGGGGGGMPEKDAGIGRLPTLCTAIFAEEGADQSHLTDHEKHLVAICKKDEFERDRILWGGGLL